MNISDDQKKLINRYFSLLVKQFIKDKKFHSKIKVDFQEQKIEGCSWYEARFYYSCFWDKDFESEEFLCEVVVHEFTHIHFLINEGSHDHDERFFSRVEFFEEWLKREIKVTINFLVN